MNELKALTGQERGVAEMVSRGMTNKQVGEAMQISEKTVKFHLTKVYKKLGVNRHELILRYSTFTGKSIGELTPDELATDLLFDVVRKGRAGLPYTEELGQLKTALANAPSIRKVVEETLKV